MYETLIEVDLLQNDNNHKQAEPFPPQQLNQTAQQGEQKLREAEALLLLVNTSARELKRPMNEVLELGTSVLTQINSNSPLTRELLKIVEQIEYMNEIVSGINRVVDYKPVHRNGNGSGR